MKDNPIRVMICDDSAVMRRLLKSAIQSDLDLEVVGQAGNGQEAIDRLLDVKPDALIMDVEMPVMDGVDAVRQIRKRDRDLPVIMFSSLTVQGAEATLDALAAGATDFVAKPTSVGHVAEAMRHVQDSLNPKIRQWVRPTPQPSLQAATDNLENATSAPEKAAGKLQKGLTKTSVAAVGIGASTGGPQALSELISSLPLEFETPILIVQHMPPVFTSLFADRLSAQKGHVVREAVDGQVVRGGEVLIAPGDHHLTTIRDGIDVRVSLNQCEREHSCRPAVDPLFRSMADCYGRKCLGIVLTGMGTDGEHGAKALRRRGAPIYVQDEESSVVWGMPGNIARGGLADQILPLDRIAFELVQTIDSCQKLPI